MNQSGLPSCWPAGGFASRRRRADQHPLNEVLNVQTYSQSIAVGEFFQIERPAPTETGRMRRIAALSRQLAKVLRVTSPDAMLNNAATLAVEIERLRCGGAATTFDSSHRFDRAKGWPVPSQAFVMELFTALDALYIGCHWQSLTMLDLPQQAVMPDDLPGLAARIDRAAKEVSDSLSAIPCGTTSVDYSARARAVMQDERLLLHIFNVMETAANELELGAGQFLCAAN